MTSSNRKVPPMENKYSVSDAARALYTASEAIQSAGEKITDAALRYSATISGRLNGETPMSAEQLITIINVATEAIRGAQRTTIATSGIAAQSGMNSTAN